MSWLAAAQLAYQAYSAYSASKGQREANEANLAFGREQMEWSAKEAEKNRSWQEYMSSTSHQREVKDLIAAGLNPILSASRGAPMGSASMPSAPAVHQENTKKWNPEVAIASAKLANEVRMTDALTAKAVSEKKLIDQEARVAERNADQETSAYGRALNWVKMTLGSGLGSMLGLIGGGGALGSAVRVASLLKKPASSGIKLDRGRSSFPL